MHVIDALHGYAVVINTHLTVAICGYMSFAYGTPMGKTGSYKGIVSGHLSNLGPRCAGYIGLLSLAQFLICLMICAFADEDWALFENTLCYLGLSDILFVRILYPITCTVVGIGIATFGYMVARSSTRKLQVIGYYICLIFGASMIGIGVFTLDAAYTLHMTCVYTMGVSAGLVIGLTAIDDFMHGNKATLLLLIVILVGFTYFSLYNMDYQQPFAYLGMFIWLIGKCIHLISTDSAY